VDGSRPRGLADTHLAVRTGSDKRLHRPSLLATTNSVQNLSVANCSAVQLDELSKAIVEKLQEDGRRSYAGIGKAVGLSEAAVRSDSPARR
jgi:hypothetical protein